MFTSYFRRPVTAAALVARLCCRAQISGRLVARWLACRIPAWN